MEKRWFESKAIIAGGILMLYGVGNILWVGAISPQFVSDVLLGLGIVGVRDALE